MKRRIELRVLFAREIDMAPSSQQLEEAIIDCIKKFLGDVGSAQFQFAIVDNGISSTDKQSLNVILEIELSSKRDFSNFLAGLSTMRVIDGNRCCTNVVSVNPVL